MRYSVPLFHRQRRRLGHHLLDVGGELRGCEVAAGLGDPVGVALTGGYSEPATCFENVGHGVPFRGWQRCRLYPVGEPTLPDTGGSGLPCQESTCDLRSKIREMRDSEAADTPIPCNLSHTYWTLCEVKGTSRGQRGHSSTSG